MNDPRHSNQGIMKEKHRTLCFPDREKTCFACCPPIRAAGYEHIQYKGMVQRVLRENTAAFRAEERGIRPITGFSCWALGYLDADFRLVGCLLHPARHNGLDLRFRIDFGDKCRRETCPEARIFEQLDPNAQAFWLHLADGLDAFSYSSRKENPLFHYLNWGPKILQGIARAEPGVVPSPESILEAFPFLETQYSPRAFAYPLARLVEHQGMDLLRDAPFKNSFEDWLDTLVGELIAVPQAESPRAVPVHRLPLERPFLDFLRLGAGISKGPLDGVEALRVRVDTEIVRFFREYGTGRAVPAPRPASQKRDRR